MPCPQVDDISIVRVNCHSLAIPTAIFISAHLEWDVCALECFAAITRSKDRPIGDLRKRVGSAGKIKPIGIRGIERDAFDTHEIHVFIGDPIEKRLPCLRLFIAPIRTSHVGTTIAHAFRRRVKHNTVDKTSANNLHIFPNIG
jgi:hypothetical protein